MDIPLLLIATSYFSWLPDFLFGGQRLKEEEEGEGGGGGGGGGGGEGEGEGEENMQL